MSPHDCPSQEALHRYAAGDLSSAGASTIDIHLGRCTVCLNRLDELSARPDDLVQALRKPLDPPHANTALAGAVAAVLADTWQPLAKFATLAPNTIINGYR